MALPLADIDLQLRSEQSGPLTTTQHDANLQSIEDAVNAIHAALARSQVTVGADVGDADATLVPGTSATVQRWDTALTADRNVTLSTTGAEAGDRFRIVRTGGGAFNLNVGTGPLKSLAANQWCEVVYDGSAWVLVGFGSL